MKIALVVMAWTFVLPSPAIEVLKAFLKRERQGDVIDCHFPYMKFAERISFPENRAIVGDDWLGEMLFPMWLYPEKRQELKGFFDL